MPLKPYQTHSPFQSASSAEDEASTNPQNVPSCTEDLPTNSEARQLLEKYSGIPKDQVIPHVLRLRDKSVHLRNYGCIKHLEFLNPSLPYHPSYPIILSLLRSGGTFLDAGCCVGQELRYLVHAGIPSAQLYGFDVIPNFHEDGYKLFCDRDRLKSTLVTGDVLAGPGSRASGGLDGLVGKMNVVFASAFLHIWDWDDMVVAAKRLVAFTKPEKGVMIVGKQLGSVSSHSHKEPEAVISTWRHNVESMVRFWMQVGFETESRWEVEAKSYEIDELEDSKEREWDESGVRIIWWSATRV